MSNINITQVSGRIFVQYFLRICLTKDAIMWYNGETAHEGRAPAILPYLQQSVKRENFFILKFFS
jgi:hypothetical protein